LKAQHSNLVYLKRLTLRVAFGEATTS